MSANSAKKVVRPKTKPADKKTFDKILEDTDVAKAPDVKIVDEKQILNHLKQECTHRNTYSYNRIASTGCVTACQLIIQGISGGQKFSEDLISTFIKRTIEPAHTSHYYRQYTCVAKIPKIIENAICNLVQTSIPSDDNLLKILSSSALDKCFHNLVNLNPNFNKFSDKFIKDAISNRFEHSCSTKDEAELIDAIFNNCDMASNLSDVVKCRNKTMNTKMAQFIDKYDGELIQEMMYSTCKSLPYTKDIFRILVSRNLQFDDKALDIVCEFCDDDSLKFVLDESRFMPKRRHFKKLTVSKIYVDDKTYNQRKDNYYYYRNTIVSRYDNGGYNMNRMEIFISYGYKPDYEDVYFGTTNKAEIPNISRFNIKPDKKLLERCWDYDFYPGYKFDCINKDMVELQKTCKTRQKSGISKILSGNKDIVPDRKCMENACTFKNNKPILELLEKKGGKYTVKCIENCAKEFKANDTLLRIISKFKTQHDAEVKEYQDKIKQLENGVVKNEDGLTTVTNNNEDELITVTDESDDIPSQQMESLDASDDENEESDEELITVEASNKADTKTKVKSLDDNLNDEDIDELLDDLGEDNEPQCVDFSKYKLNKPSNLRAKADIPDSYRIHFKKKKGDKMSFINLKKEFLDKIKKNKWYMDGNQQYVDLPKTLRKRLKLDDTSYVSFNDLDSLMYLFYA